MAVYERTYRPYQGPLTPVWSHFMILPRYAYQQVLGSRLFVGYMVLACGPLAAAALLIYLHHNLTALAMMHLQAANIIPINEVFFLGLLSIQGWIAFILALFMGPALISPDLANNGLALYLCRPFSRREYILGKFCVLALLMSLITWVPCLLLFLFEAYLEGWQWFLSNAFIGAAILLASWLWIVLLTLMTMASSAWVRRKPMAAAGVLIFFFVARGMGQTINLIYRTSWGDLIDVGKLTTYVWMRLFRIEGFSPSYPIVCAWSSLILFCGVCLWLLSRKVRAYQVVR